MSLAIEYLFRTGIANDLFCYPCSLFLTHFINKSHKKIVTIKQSKNKLKISHWNLYDFNKDHQLPKHETFIINISNLLNSDLTIVPEFELLKFIPSKYKATIQRHDPSIGDIQQAEYENFLNTFLNPRENSFNREKWLWVSFLECHKLYNFELKYKTKAKQMDVVFGKYDYLKNKWFKWLINFYFKYNKNIASELFFNEAYRAKKNIENDNIGQIYKMPKILIN